MKCAEVDLARARYKVRDAKTAKGEREVEMTAWSHNELVRYRAQRLHDGFPMGAEDCFFGTKTGSRRDPNRFRDRVLGRSVKLANERRAEQGLPPLPRITPTLLRRTWAMLAAQAGRDPKWISDQIGHTSAAFTLQVYRADAPQAPDRRGAPGNPGADALRRRAHRVPPHAHVDDGPLRNPIGRTVSRLG